MQQWVQQNNRQLKGRTLETPAAERGREGERREREEREERGGREGPKEGGRPSRTTAKEGRGGAEGHSSHGRVESERGTRNSMGETAHVSLSPPLCVFT